MQGGIYDHLEGGFSRYTVDEKWLIPHFEKMLYDNAQLVSLYSKAYQITKKPLYKEVVIETLEFIKRKMTKRTEDSTQVLTLTRRALKVNIIFGIQGN